jgi:tight adherence protein B
MEFSLVVAFIVIFALVLACVGLGMKYFEARRKKHVTGMLQTVAGAPEITISNILREEVDPNQSVVERMLTKFNFADKARSELQQAGMPWSPTKLVSIMAVGAALGMTIGIMFPLIWSPAVTVLLLTSAGGMLPFLFVHQKRGKRLAKFEEQFPEALDFLARSMRAGHAFTISLEMIGDEIGDPLGQEFRTLFNEQNLGAPLEVALRNLVQRVPLLDVRFFGSSVMLQKQTGGNLSEILSRLAYVIRERFRLKGQVKAASAHGRLTAAILTILPVVTMIGLLIIAPGYLQGMAADPDGKWLIVGAIVAQVIGNICIRKIINIKV